MSGRTHLCPPAFWYAHKNQGTKKRKSNKPKFHSGHLNPCLPKFSFPIWNPLALYYDFTVPTVGCWPVVLEAAAITWKHVAVQALSPSLCAVQKLENNCLKATTSNHRFSIEIQSLHKQAGARAREPSCTLPQAGGHSSVHGWISSKISLGECTAPISRCSFSLHSQTDEQKLLLCYILCTWTGS